VTPLSARNVSSMRKWPVKVLSRVRIRWAASARISGVRERCIVSSPPTMKRMAEVAMVVRGHRALTATRPRNSSASPRAARLMANLAME
jgi:hypothetical protein